MIYATFIQKCGCSDVAKRNRITELVSKRPIYWEWLSRNSLEAPVMFQKVVVVCSFCGAM